MQVQGYRIMYSLPDLLKSLAGCSRQYIAIAQQFAEDCIDRRLELSPKKSVNRFLIQGE